MILQSAASAALATGHARAQDLYAGQFLAAKKTSSQLLGPGGKATGHWHFETARTPGSTLPMLRARQGQEVHYQLFNALDEAVLLHFFGIRGPADVMSVLVEPGNITGTDVVFTPPDAGTFWFGPVLRASRQRAMGLHGMLIVDEAAPTPYFDQPLIFQEWKLTDNGLLEQGFGDLEIAAGVGRLGNWHTVNGKLKPHIKLDAARPARLRLLNTANARDANVQFKDATLLLLALDGQPVTPSEVAFSNITLAPGQRADVALREAAAEVAISVDLGSDALEVAFLQVPPGALRPFGGNFPLPANPVPVPGATAPPQVIEVIIEGGLKGGLKSARVGGTEVDLRGLLERGIAWSVNGIAGPSDQPLFEAAAGETLVLAVTNKTKFPQPLHIHGHVWKVVEAAGAVMQNQPWRDTAVVTAMATVKLLFVAGSPGLWGLQSLVAERCDSGLFATFRVNAAT